MDLFILIFITPLLLLVHPKWSIGGGGPNDRTTIQEEQNLPHVFFLHRSTGPNSTAKNKIFDMYF